VVVVAGVVEVGVVVVSIGVVGFSTDVVVVCTDVVSTWVMAELTGTPTVILQVIPLPL